MDKMIKIFMGFIVGFIFTRIKQSDVPSILGSTVSDYVSLIVNLVGFILMIWMGCLIISELFRITRKP